MATGVRNLPEGVQQGTYAIRPVNAEDGSTVLELDITGFIGFWPEAKQDIIRAVRNNKPDTIKLFISSLGGFVDDALAIHDFLSASEARVEVRIAGMTASAATVVALAGDDIQISDNALFLVHHASAGLLAFGKVEDIEEAADEAARMLRKVNGRILNLYQKRTGLSTEELDELLAKEEWLTPQEALDLGFVDGIYEPDSATASAAPNDFAAVLSAIGLPPIPTQSNHSREMADKTQETQKTEVTAEKEIQKSAAAENQPDERAQLAQMQAEMEQLKAMNAQLQEDRRQARLQALRETLTGRVPGKAVDELISAVDRASTEKADVIAAITEAVKHIPEMVSRGVVEVDNPSRESQETIAKATVKM